jgi:hypothetical protein
MLKVKILFFLLSLFLVRQQLSAQEVSRQVISNGGGTVTNGTIIFSYNIGEPITDLYISPFNGSFAIGFMQPDANFVTPILTKNISEELVVFPNPVTTGTAKLNFKNIPDGNYQVDIVDAVGHVLYTKTIAQSINNKINLDLNVTGFKGGTYYIRVRNGSVQGQVKLVKL